MARNFWDVSFCPFIFKCFFYSSDSSLLLWTKCLLLRNIRYKCIGAHFDQWKQSGMELLCFRLKTTLLYRVSEFCEFAALMSVSLPVPAGEHDPENRESGKRRVAGAFVSNAKLTEPDARSHRVLQPRETEVATDNRKTGRKKCHLPR